jgi:hypothetical protein
VRITDKERKPLSSVYLALTDSEERELIGALSTLRSAQPGWHEHINDETYQHEITVYREDDPTANFAKPF